MRIVETCPCGARFETSTHVGISDFRRAHADCRAAWIGRQQAKVAPTCDHDWRERRSSPDDRWLECWLCGSIVDAPLREEDQ